MQANRSGRVTGHVWLYEGKRAATWYAKYRDASGVQRQTRIGRRWAKKGPPPSGYFTRRTAEDALDALLTDLRRQAPTTLANGGARTAACTGGAGGGDG